MRGKPKSAEWRKEELEMAKADQVVSFIGSCESGAVALAKKTVELGGNLFEAVALLGRPEHEGAVSRLADILAGVCKKARNIFSIVCEGVKASELVKRGRYDWVNSDITDELFPIEEHASQGRTIELIEFGHDPTSEEVIAEFARRDLERPTHEDALAFGIAYPEEQRKHPVIFLHEPVLALGGLRVLVLGGGGRGRDLGLRWFGGRWNRVCVFAAVRK